MAKLIIKLINAVAPFIHNDPDVRDRLKVLFLPNYNVKGAQHIFPAADLSEQISTAGKEASGTGNMKFTLNGALTIGTLDGANVEIRAEVGSKNFFFLVSRQSTSQSWRSRGHRPRDYYERNSMLRDVIDLIASGALGGGDKKLFGPIVDNLLWHNPYFLLADFQSFPANHEKMPIALPRLCAWRLKVPCKAKPPSEHSSDASRFVLVRRRQ